MLTALHYTAITPPTGSERTVFGLQVAIADWLRAWFRYGNSEKFTFLIGGAQEELELREIAALAGLDPARLALRDRRFPEQNLADISAIFRPEPDTRHLLWQRQFAGSFSFCGLAHAISGTEAGAVLQDYCLAPSESTDALVCPSRAVQSAIRAFWDHYSDYLHERFGAVYKCPVQLPVIPLGIDIGKFAQRVTPDKRVAQRAALHIGDEDIVLLWVGRLSAAIKAHPLAMFRAAELAAEQSGARVHLVMQGYFVPDEAEAQFQQLAAATCAKTTVHFIATNDARFTDGLWAAGDIFLSLIDNMQESFGLTPIEAMAAGLPRVISDWNGYRDSVTDGEDGFLIRTWQPPAGNGFALTAQVASGREIYGGFLAKAALTVAVDIEQAAQRIALLITDKDLRLRMSAKARERVIATYDWQHIIPAYENLWQEQAARRAKAAPPRGKWLGALPTLPDPYKMYETYPSARLGEQDHIGLAASLDEIRILWQHGLNTYAHDIMLPPAELALMIGWLGESNTQPIQAVFTRFSSSDRPCLWRSLAWLLKLGIIKISV